MSVKFAKGTKDEPESSMSLVANSKRPDAKGVNKSKSDARGHSKSRVKRKSGANGATSRTIHSANRSSKATQNFKRDDKNVNRTVLERNLNCTRFSQFSDQSGDGAKKSGTGEEEEGDDGEEKIMRERDDFVEAIKVFHGYLRRCGLTKIIIGALTELYENQGDTEDPLLFMKTYFDFALGTGGEFQKLTAMLENLTDKVETVLCEIEMDMKLARDFLKDPQLDEFEGEEEGSEEPGDLDSENQNANRETRRVRFGAATIQAGSPPRSSYPNKSQSAVNSPRENNKNQEAEEEIRDLTENEEDEEEEKEEEEEEPVPKTSRELRLEEMVERHRQMLEKMNEADNKGLALRKDIDDVRAKMNKWEAEQKKALVNTIPDSIVVREKEVKTEEEGEGEENVEEKEEEVEEVDKGNNQNNKNGNNDFSRKKNKRRIMSAKSRS